MDFRTVSVNESGSMVWGGCDTVELANQYGTPLYVMDEEGIRSNCREFNWLIKKYYGNGLAVFASKALCCKEICRIMAEEDMGLDTVSGGELYTAIQAGFPAEKIYFHGNNKTEAELCMALDHNVGRIVVDNIFELEKLNVLAGEREKKASVFFRIKPGIDAHTHDFVKTGQIDSKFGVALETGEALEIVKKACAMQNVEVRGLHCHIGSQIFDPEPFELAAKVMIEFMAQIKKEIGLTLTELNLGGGFGIRYVESDQPESREMFMRRLCDAVREQSKSNDLPEPYLIIEPGRSMVGNAGITLYTVGAVKEIPNIRTYVSVDGGMTDNPRYILYGSSYTALIANKASLPADFTATIAGRCCETGDLIQEHTLIQKPEAGDILAVLDTGAYNYSMSMRYNRVPGAAMVMAKNGESRIIVRRETYEDIIQRDV